MADQDKKRSKSSSSTSQTVSAFICYRRNDGAWHADWVDQALNGLTYVDANGATRRISTYYDRTAPGVADWKRHHFPSLQSAHALLLICTPGMSKDLTRPEHPDWVYEELRWWAKHRKYPPIVIDAAGDGGRWLPDLVNETWPNLNRLGLERTEAEDALKSGDGRYLSRWREQVLNTIRESERATSFETVAKLKRLARGLGIALAAAVMLLVVAGISWRQASQSDEASRQAIGFIRDLFAQADPDKTYGEALTAGQLLLAGTAEIERQDLGPRVKWRVLQAMGAAYTGRGEKQRSVDLLQEAAKLAEGLWLDREDRYQLEFALGEALLAQDAYDAAKPHFEDARKLADSIHAGNHADRSAALIALGDVEARSDSGKPTEARKLYDEALLMDSALGDHADMARDHNRIGSLEFYSGDPVVAAKEYESAIDTARKAPKDARNLLAAQYGHDYATTLYGDGQFDVAYSLFDDACKKFEVVYGRDSGEVADVENNMGRILIERDETDKARPLLEHAVRVQEKFGTDFHALAFSRNNLALVDMIEGKLAEARPRFETAAGTAEKHDLHIGAQSLIHLAEIDLAKGNPADAKHLLDQAGALFQEHPAWAADWRLALHESAMGEVYLQRCDLKKANQLLAKSGAILRKRWHTDNVFIRNDLRRRELLEKAKLNPQACKPR